MDELNELTEKRKMAEKGADFSGDFWKREPKITHNPAIEKLLQLK